MNAGVSVHILILDDDEGLLRLTRKILERHGYRVSTMSNAQTAHEAVQADCPTLLIVDYDLKTAQTGLDFFRDVHHLCGSVPAIMVSGYADESRVIEALRAGVADVLPKSGDYLDYLPEAVERVLSQVRLRKRLTEAEMMRDREHYYRNLAEAIPQLVWTCLPDGMCDFLSKQWLDYTGLPEHEQLGMGWLYKVMHADDRERTYQAWMSAVSGNADYDLEFRLRRSDGIYRWFKTRGVPVRDARGRVTKWFGTCTDIEEQKKTEQDRELLLESERAARSEAERAVRAKDEFVATLSHELRTPLNAIVGWAQFLLRDRSDPEKLQKGLEVIDRNAKLQSQLVDDLLDMSRIMSGKLRLDVQCIDLADVIENVVASVQPASDAKEIKLSVTIEPGAGTIQGDASRLQQVLWNLLMNAIKFTQRQGRVSVMLRTVRGDAEVSIRDNGAGIKPEFIGHVFDRFRQQDGTVARKFNGLGLGLAIAKQLVELHGGRIEAASDGEGLGATFSVHLPLVMQTANGAVAVEGNIGYSDLELALDGLQILLVEDEPDGRELVQRILEERGATVIAVDNAGDALNAFTEHKPHIIVSDIGLPGEDGYSFMRRLRKLEGRTKTITPAAALTALAHGDNHRRALLSGFQTYIAKPVDPLELVVVVASLTGRMNAKVSEDAK